MYKMVAVLLLAMCPMVFGRYGETKEQCDKRYGKPVEAPIEIVNGFTNCLYKKGGYFIEIIFWKGKAGCVTYCNSESDSQYDRVALTEEEKQILLRVNSGGGKWKKAKEDANKYEKEGGMFAVYIMEKFIVSSKEDSDRLSEALKAQEEGSAEYKLKGF